MKRVIGYSRFERIKAYWSLDLEAKGFDPEASEATLVAFFHRDEYYVEEGEQP